MRDKGGLGMKEEDFAQFINKPLTNENIAFLCGWWQDDEGAWWYGNNVSPYPSKEHHIGGLPDFLSWVEKGLIPYFNDMWNILASPDSTPDERFMAYYTIEDVLWGKEK